MCNTSGGDKGLLASRWQCLQFLAPVRLPTPCKVHAEPGNPDATPSAWCYVDPCACDLIDVMPSAWENLNGVPTLHSLVAFPWGSASFALHVRFKDLW